MMPVVQTAHRQFGSKARVAAQLLRLVPDDVKVWVEGFAGTAALTLAKPEHQSEHLNDLNGDVTNLFTVMRDDGQLARLCRLVEFTPFAQEEFLRCRDLVHAIDATDAADAADPVERARCFLVATWQGFAGKQRSRTGWRWSVDPSTAPAVTWARVPMRLATVALRLKRVHIHRRHIIDLVDRFDRAPSAFLFLDPPYPISAIGAHESMYRVDMDDAEHAALAERLLTLKCRVLLTMAGGGGDVYSQTLKGWHVVPYRVRNLSNVQTAEVALMNYAPPLTLALGEAS